MAEVEILLSPNVSAASCNRWNQEHVREKGHVSVNSECTRIHLQKQLKFCNLEWAYASSVEWDPEKLLGFLEFAELQPNGICWLKQVVYVQFVCIPFIITHNFRCKIVWFDWKASKNLKTVCPYHLRCARCKILSGGLRCVQGLNPIRSIWKISEDNIDNIAYRQWIITDDGLCK